LADILKVSKALADPIRIDILNLLHQGTNVCCSVAEEMNTNSQKGLCVCDFVDHLGMSQSKISYHLRELKNAGLIKEQAIGRWNYYTLNKHTLQAYLQEIQKQFS